jgi:hypothetical protein
MTDFLSEFDRHYGSILSDDEIIDLKSTLRNNNRLQARICAFLAIHQSLLDEGEVGPHTVEAGGSVNPETFHSFETREDFAGVTAEKAALQMVALEKAVNLPAAEWPDHHRRPEDFAFALLDMEAATASLGDSNG